MSYHLLVGSWQERALELRRSGLTTRAIGKELGIGVKKVRDLCVQHGLMRTVDRACKQCGEAFSVHSNKDQRILCLTCCPTPRDNHRIRTYGLARPQFDALWDAQGGKCALCLDPLSEDRHRGVHVDHCHATGRVRGLLCIVCNRTLGSVERRPGWLERAAAYLQR